MTRNVKNISDLTDKQIKGIDLAFKALKKTYPFIKGWEINEKYKETYTSLIFLNLTIDIKETANYIKASINPFWEEEIKKKPISSYSIGGFFTDIPNEEEVRQLRNTIEEKMRSLYDRIPDDFAIYNQMESIAPNEYFDFKVNIAILNYKHINQ